MLRESRFLGGKNAGSDERHSKSGGCMKLNHHHVFLGDDAHETSMIERSSFFFFKTCVMFLFVKISLCFAGVLKNSASYPKQTCLPKRMSLPSAPCRSLFSERLGAMLILANANWQSHLRPLRICPTAVATGSSIF